MTDPIADMLTRIRNSQVVLAKTVEIPYSDFKYNIAKILQEQKFIDELKTNNLNNKDKKIIITLKYKDKLPAIRELKRISKPSMRIYIRAKNIKLIKRGYGFLILSTPLGLMTSKEAKKKNIGGEVICEVW
jgi:small subunit ribosomal protein S8